MKPGDDALTTVIVHFLSLSFLAIGGVIATLPEMHRIAVDLEHWMTDREFAEMFALAQIAPGPNMMIVTLIGYRAAGWLGGFAATACVAVPPAIFAYLVAMGFHRVREATWPVVFRAALVPVSVGLMLATMVIISVASAQSYAAWALLAVSTALMLWTRLHPLLLLFAGGVIGFLGLI